MNHLSSSSPSLPWQSNAIAWLLVVYILYFPFNRLTRETRLILNLPFAFFPYKVLSLLWLTLTTVTEPGIVPRKSPANGPLAEIG